MARSAAEVVHGYTTFDPEVEIAGVIFNKVGSDHHEQLLREAVDPLGVPVLGVLRRDARLAAPERHLGLVPAVEREAQTCESIDTLSDACARQVDLDAVLALANRAPVVRGEEWSPQAAATPGLRSRIAIADGPAFSFQYRENIELLEAAGAELLPFDPLVDEALPADAGGLLLAGGFPEVYGAELAANASLREQVAAFALSGRPVLAECGGLLYLCTELDDHAMCGALPLRARMTQRLTLGYREAAAATATPWLEEGERVRGHEFHYTQLEPQHGDHAPAWVLSARGTDRTDGIVMRSVQASYLHVHWAAHPRIAARFTRAARMDQTVAA
jgi:cobyrinic acid a,c-diamide synthase